MGLFEGSILIISIVHAFNIVRKLINSPPQLVRDTYQLQNFRRAAGLIPVALQSLRRGLLALLDRMEVSTGREREDPKSPSCPCSTSFWGFLLLSIAING